MRTEHCDAHRIEAYLTGELAPELETDLLQHVETCVDCRQRMEDTAADKSTWESACDFLVDDEFDSALLSGLEDLPNDFSPQSADEIHAAEVSTALNVLNPTDDPKMLGRLGPYEVSGVVGVGGMGVVMKGHDPSLDRTVAIKVLAPHLASSGAARKRFAREAKAAAAVLHPNVMSIHSVSNEGALPYLVMPFMRGSSLQKRIDEQGPLTTIEVLRVATQIASGLAAAHAQGLVHRDIKPANMMLAQGLERVAITDFGLARAVDDATMTRSGVIAGTPQYMSPEQARGEAIDARSDLFSLGSLIYAMCTGHSPFRAETSFGVLRRITDEAPRKIRQINPEIPEWLSQIVRKLLEKDPSDRFQTAREVEQLLSQCLAHLEQPDHHGLPEQIKDLEPKQTGEPTESSDLERRSIAPLVFVAGALLVALLAFPFVPKEWIQSAISPALNSGNDSHLVSEESGSDSVHSEAESTPLGSGDELPNSTYGVSKPEFKEDNERLVKESSPSSGIIQANTEADEIWNSLFLDSESLSEITADVDSLENMLLNSTQYEGANDDKN